MAPRKKARAVAQLQRSTQSGETNKGFSLLELPAELRHQVYQYCCLPPYPKVKCSTFPAKLFLQDRCVHFGLMLSCRQIHDECIEQCTCEHILHFTESYNFANKFLCYLSTPIIKRIKHISLDMHGLAARCASCKTPERWFSSARLGACDHSTMVTEFRRLVSIVESYPELCDLEQFDIRMVSVRPLKDKLCDVILTIVKLFMMERERRGVSSYYIVSLSCDWFENLGWVSFQRVSAATWGEMSEVEKIYDDDLVECEFGCGETDEIHLCSKKGGMLVQGKLHELRKIAREKFQHSSSGESASKGGEYWKVVTGGEAPRSGFGFTPDLPWHAAVYRRFGSSLL